MTIDEWMKEVRRLVIATDSAYDNRNGLTHEVLLDHRARTKDAGKSYGPPTWIAKCCLASVEAETAEDAMRGLVEKLHDKLVDKIESTKRTLAALESSLERRE